MMTQQDWLKSVPNKAENFAGWLYSGKRLWQSTTEMGQAIKDAAHKALSKALPEAEQLAHGLIALGKQEEEEALIALGEMALGDALRLQLRGHEGSALLDQAAERFLRIGDQVGWARTRIGWLGSVHHLPNHPLLEPIVEEAVDIFTKHQAWAWLSSLCHNYAYHWIVLGQLSEGLPWCIRAREAAERIKKGPKSFIPLVSSLIMLINVYHELGLYEAAQRTIKDTLVIFEGNEELVHRYVDFLVITGRYYLDTGRYTQALFYFYDARRRANSFWGQINVDSLIASAYLRLNRYEECEALLLSLLERLADNPDFALQEGVNRIRLAHLYNNQRRWQEGLTMLEPAIRLMKAQPKRPVLWLSQAYQHQALLQYHLGQVVGLKELVYEAIDLAEEGGEPLALVGAYMAAAEVLESDREAGQMLELARDSIGEIPWLRWHIYQLIARRTTDLKKRRLALVHAVHDLEKVQSSLAASFHADYLADAQSLYDELIALYLEEGEVELAWQTIEQAKSRALLNVIIYQQEEGNTRADSPLTAELERLQLRHYEVIKGVMEGRISSTEVQTIEAEIARIQEAIEVEHLGRREPLTVPPPYLPEAPKDSDLIGFYLVREEVHGFVHNGESYHHIRLSPTVSKLNEFMTALFANMRTTPNAPNSWIRPLTAQLHNTLAKLDKFLLAPLRPFLRHEKLLFVPHGLLHQLPFHLLRHRGRYLLEGHEVRIVPTARLAQRLSALTHSSEELRHLVITHSWNGHLPYTKEEGQLVANILGNSTQLDERAATKKNLLREMREIRGVLHIAAHGAHRPDKPEFSHIQLAEGQLSLVDLFQHTFQCSLVTLSACETGQVVIRAGDDPVGLWRGFLAAGASSLLVALWQLEDQSALLLMRNFYQKLANGVPKMAALRAIQQEWLASAEGRLRHPFYWGALQLIGDDGTLDQMG